MDINGKVAVITGAGSGIGRATALRLAKEGASIVVADMNDAGAAETVAMVEQAGGKASPIHVDVTKPGDLDNMFAFAEKIYGGFEILHNNAGVTTGPPRFPDCPPENWKRTIMIDLVAVIESTQKAIPYLKKRGGGVIVNTASLAGLFGFAADPVYAAAKHGVVGITRALAGLKDEANIRVNAVCPGVVRTPMATGALNNLSGEALEQAKRVIDAMPMIDPADIAQGVVEFIQDDDATGQTMGITHNQPHRIVPPPINLPLTSGDAAATARKRS